MKKIRRLLNKKDGTTLVETIVTMLLISIMFAMAATALSSAAKMFVREQRLQYAQSILDTTMTELRGIVENADGYINKAKEKSIVAETRQAVMAAQTLVDEAYGKLDLTAADDAIEIGTGAVEGKTVVKISDIATLAEVKEANITSATVKAGKVTGLVYTNDGKTCTYTAGTDGGKGTYDVK